MRKIYGTLIALSLIFMQNTQGEGLVVSSLNNASNKLRFNLVVSVKMTHSRNTFLLIDANNDVVLNLTCAGFAQKTTATVSRLSGAIRYLTTDDSNQGKKSLTITQIDHDAGNSCVEKLQDIIVRKAPVIIEQDPSTFSMDTIPVILKTPSGARESKT